MGRPRKWDSDAKRMAAQRDVVPASEVQPPEGAAAPLPPIRRGNVTLEDAVHAGATLGAHEHDRLTAQGRTFASATDPKDGKAVATSPKQERADRIERAIAYAEGWHALTGRLPL